MHYHSIIWDWNGTLLDDVELAVAVVNDILLDHRLEELTTERYRKIFDFPVQLYYERAGMDFSELSFESISERFCLAFEKNIDTAQLFRDVPNSLTQIRQAGIEQYVLSATEHEALLRMVSGFGIASTFDGIRGMPDGLAREKAGIGQALIDTHDIDVSKTLMVGDTRHDWEVAETLGIDCVLVATGHHSYERLTTLGCPVFDSIGALINHLED